MTVAADVQWGTVGEWVSGGGALAAAVVAVVVPLVIWSHDRRQREAADAQRQADEERRRSHAVNAWVELRDDPSRATFGSPMAKQAFAVVTNVGADVITDWYAEIGFVTGEMDALVHHWHRIMESMFAGSLPPGQRIEAEVPTENLRTSGRAAVVFADAFGVRWRREGNEVGRAEDADEVRRQSEDAALGRDADDGPA